MKTSRQRILDYLAVKEVATSAEISQTFQMTPANARYHLINLMDEGLVQVIGQYPEKRRGRPTLIYQLSASARRHNLDRLSSLLLQQHLESVPEAERVEKIRNLAEKFTQGINLQSKNMTQRLNQICRFLNAWHYDSRWEAHVRGPRLILMHCPYAAILEQHSALCQIDQAILTRLLETPVTQIAKRESSPLGFHQCIFTLE